MCFFLDANDHIYSRYGGRDGGDAEGRLSVAGLKYTMRQILEEHQPSPTFTPPRKPTLPQDLFMVRNRGCMHCHNVWEGLRRQARADGTFQKESLYVYPLPENIGLKLDVTAGNKVVEVKPNSPGSRAGIQPDDLLTVVHDIKIHSQCDIMYALHTAPSEGKIHMQWLHAGKPEKAHIELTRGWKETDLSWRASMRRERR
jgi:hypothetical protein